MLAKKKERTPGRSNLKLTISLFLGFVCFVIWPSWKLWSQLAGKYVSFTFAVSV